MPKAKSGPGNAVAKSRNPAPRPGGRTAKAHPTPLIRVRILAGSQTAMGPGKADLLDAIAETGSISAAARHMGMSYRRAWLLVDTMNACFVHPLVSKEKGGAEGGGATLTPTGARVLRQYRRIAASVSREFAALIRDTDNS